MPNQTGSTPHEALEIHELLRTEVTCLKKAQASIGMVNDPDLRSFMEDSITAKKSSLRNIEQLYSRIQNSLQ